MSQIILHILCEGPTEEKFALTTLRSHLQSYSIIVKAYVLYTNKKKQVRGGLHSYTQIKQDLQLLINQNGRNRKYEKHYYTTMCDLYALPTDFPYNRAVVDGLDCYVRVKSIEEAFAKDIALPTFIPYIQLHEFEALVFSKLDELHSDYPDNSKDIDGLKAELKACGGNPEKVNSSPEKAPSKRLATALGKYNKTKSGPMVAEKAGIAHLKQECCHFREWVEKLEALKP